MKWRKVAQRTWTALRGKLEVHQWPPHGMRADSYDAYFCVSGGHVCIGDDFETKEAAMRAAERWAGRMARALTKEPQ
jgi:hypothetical protein